MAISIKSGRNIKEDGIVYWYLLKIYPLICKMQNKQKYEFKVSCVYYYWGKKKKTKQITLIILWHDTMKGHDILDGRTVHKESKGNSTYLDSINLLSHSCDWCLWNDRRYQGKNKRQKENNTSRKLEEKILHLMEGWFK